MVLLRREVGDVLRDVRLTQGKTLREVSAQARVSLGYLSEIERGHKEASSEVLFSIATALGLSLSDLMSAISAKLAVLEAERAPRGRMVVAA